jgi:hypothetical protein
MKPTSKLRLGDLLVQEGLITPEQADQALSVQKNQKVYKPLGEVCLELKFLSRMQLNLILNKYQKNIQLP